MKLTNSESLHTDTCVNYKSFFEEKEVRTATIIICGGLTRPKKGKNNDILMY